MTKFSKDKVLRLHQYIASETGGSIGLRDEGLLESALESAFATFGGKELYPTKEGKAARIGASLVSNHAFLDGNKCIAECFAREGATVHVIDCRDGPWFVGNLADKAVVERFAGDVIAKSGKVDVLVFKWPCENAQFAK